jgi:hypothetical protein
VWADAVEARFEPIALSGGLSDARGVHHAVDVIVCDSGFEARRAAACARRAVNDHVAAVVGMAAVDSDEVWPILERARIPVIGPRVTTLRDASSPMSFPIAAGVPGVYVALPQLLARAGARRIGVVVTDYGTATDALLQLIQQGASHTAATVVSVVRVARAVPDVVVAARAMVQSGVDGVIGFVEGGDPGALSADLAQAGFGGWYATQAAVGSGSLASDPGDTQDALVVGQFAPVASDVSGMRRFRNDMDQASHGAELARTEGAVNGWASAWIFQRLATRLRQIDARSMLHALARLNALDMGGITPPLTTTPVDGRPFERLFNPTVTFQQATAGSITLLANGFVDPFTASPR